MVYEIREWCMESRAWCMDFGVIHTPRFRFSTVKNPYTTLQIWNASLCNLDTTLITHEIWKYLSRAAVFFETIHHSGFALEVYGLKKHCYPCEIFPYFTLEACGIY